MSHTLLNFAHLLGVILLASGLIAAGFAEWRSRDVLSLRAYLEVVRAMRVLRDALVIPGGVLLIASGGALIARYHHGIEALRQPWLLAMVVLFSFGFLFSNGLARRHARRLERLAGDALIGGAVSREWLQAQERLLPRLAHSLEVPVLIVILWLGIDRPQVFDGVLIVTLCALFSAGLLAYVLPRVRPSRCMRRDAAETGEPRTTA